jgi:hypothetical protein
MHRYLHALFSVGIALCGVLLVAVPRFFLLPPVPVGIVAHNMHRLPPNHRGEAKADTGKRDHHEGFFASAGPGMRFVSLECINDHQEGNAYSPCRRPMMFNDNTEVFHMMTRDSASSRLIFIHQD